MDDSKEKLKFKDSKLKSTRLVKKARCNFIVEKKRQPFNTKLLSKRGIRPQSRDFRNKPVNTKIKGGGYNKKLIKPAKSSLNPPVQTSNPNVKSPKIALKPVTSTQNVFKTSLSSPNPIYKHTSTQPFPPPAQMEVYIDLEKVLASNSTFSLAHSSLTPSRPKYKRKESQMILTKQIVGRIM
jgi:hypothetical protein